MPTPQHIFALTRSEQRVVILMMIALLGLAVARYYHGDSLGAPLKPPISAAPEASPIEEDSPAGEVR